MLDEESQIEEWSIVVVVEGGCLPAAGEGVVKIDMSGASFSTLID